MASCWAILLKKLEMETFTLSSVSRGRFSNFKALAGEEQHVLVAGRGRWQQWRRRCQGTRRELWVDEGVQAPLGGRGLGLGAVGQVAVWREGR